MHTQLRYKESTAQGVVYETRNAQKVLVITSYVVAQKVKMLRKSYDAIFFEPDSTITQTQIRTIIEKNWCDSILHIDAIYSKDSLKQYDSLASSVVVKLCAKKNISIVVSVRSLQNIPFSSYINRVLQTKRLCEKYSCKHKVIAVIAQNELWYEDKDILALENVLLTHLVS